MVKYDSHIDVLFREGLRDMETLPPESLWEDIQPVMRRRKNKGIFFRIAAGMAILISIGAMAYYAGNMLNVDNGPNITVADNSLSTLFDASYLNIEVESGIDINQGEDINPAITDNDIEEIGLDNSELNPDPIINKEKIDLVYDEPRNNILRLNDTPREVTARRNPSIVLVSEILPVEPVKNNANIKRWQLGAMVSPTYLSNNLNSTNEALNQINDNENAILSYSGGFSLRYRMSKRLSVQTGLYYSSLGREIEGVTSYSGFGPYASSKSGTIFGVETSSGTINSTNNDIYLADQSANRIDSYYSVDNFDPVKSNLIPFGNQLRQSFEYLEIPLILRYKLIDRKLDFNILGGMSYNFLIGNYTWAMNSEGSKVLLGSTEGVDHLLLSSSLGMSMEYEVSERFSLNLEPHFRYFLNTGGDLGSGNPYTFGIFSGMNFRF